MVDRERKTRAEAVAESRLASARRGKRELKPGALRDGVGFVWRVLTGTERQEAEAHAYARFAQLGLPHEYRAYASIEDETWYQVLWRALRDPDDPNLPLARDVDELRDLIGDEERDELATAYGDFEEEVNPIGAARPISEAEFEAIVEAIKKNDPARGISFGSVTLWRCLVSMADRLSSSQKLRSSSSSSSGPEKSPNP